MRIQDTAETGADLLRLTEDGLSSSGLDRWDNCRSKGRKGRKADDGGRDKYQKWHGDFP